MSDPVPLEDAKDFLASIGMMTILWAQTEGVLDALVASIYFQGGGEKLEPQHPRQLDRKLSFLRECYKRLTPLHCVAEEGNELVDRFHRLKQKRHDLVHGFVRKAHADKLEFSVIKKDKRKPHGFSFEPQTLTHDELVSTLEAVCDLADFAEQHFDAVLFAIFGEGGEDALSGLAD